MGYEENKRKRSADALANAALGGAAFDTVRRFGSGIKEHIVAYSGTDNETGTALKRSLKSISQSKVNPDYAKQNLKQQAGFSAEVLEVKRRRAEEAIAGKKPSTIRTDDIPGHVNDPLYDITSAVDANGNPIPGASAQMKFVGSSPKDAVGKMMGAKYEKYIDADCKILVPSDYYDGMQSELNSRIASLEEQAAKLRSKGDSANAAKCERQLEKCRKLKDNLEKSTASSEDAMEARLHPKTITAKDILKTANRAGLEQAQTGAAFGGGISLVRNAIAVCRDKKTFAQAARDVACDTVEAGAVSYATGFAGSVIKGTLQNAESSTLRAVSKTGLPAMIATATLEIGKTLARYWKGEIDGTECLDELGERGCGMISAGMFTAAGQLAIPIPFVGAAIGSMVGYALSSACYRTLLDSLKDAKLARERRIAIERQCEEMIAEMRAFRLELEETVRRRSELRKLALDSALSGIKDALATGNVDGCICAANEIVRHAGKEPLYENMQGFHAMMLSNAEMVF